MKNNPGPYVQSAGRGQAINKRMQPLLTNPTDPNPTDPNKKPNVRKNDDGSTTTITTSRQPGTQNGRRGYFDITDTRTDYPGSGGGSGSGTIKRTPEGDAAYAALTQAQRAAQDAKWEAMQAGTPGRSTSSQTRKFVPQPEPIVSNLTPKPIVTLTPSFDTPAPRIELPKKTVTVKPPPRPSWSKPGLMGSGGRSNNSRSSGKKWNQRGFGETLRRIFTGCKTC
jgi:hypothetical protein